MNGTMTPYARWAYVAELPENQILRLADIGAREAHYVYAGQSPDRYHDGHSGGSMVCGHADCRALQAAIWKAVSAVVALTDAQLLRAWRRARSVISLTPCENTKGTRRMKLRTAMVMLLAVLLGTVSCAKTQAQLVLTEDAVHDALAKADDQVRRICTGPDAVALKQVCADTRTALIPALEAGAAFNRAVAAQKLSGLAPLIESVGKLTTAVKKLPQGQTGEIVLELGRAIAAAYAEVKK